MPLPRLPLCSSIVQDARPHALLDLQVGEGRAVSANSEVKLAHDGNVPQIGRDRVPHSALVWDVPMSIAPL